MAQSERAREDVGAGAGGAVERRLTLAGLARSGVKDWNWPRAPFNSTNAVQLHPPSTKFAFQCLPALRVLCSSAAFRNSAHSLPQPYISGQSDAAGLVRHCACTQPIDIAYCSLLHNQLQERTFTCILAGAGLLDMLPEIELTCFVQAPRCNDALTSTSSNAHGRTEKVENTYL